MKKNGISVGFISILITFGAFSCRQSSYNHFDFGHIGVSFNELTIFLNSFQNYKNIIYPENKLGCVVRMVVDTILSHAKCGPNDHRKDAPLFIIELYYYIISHYYVN